MAKKRVSSNATQLENPPGKIYNFVKPSKVAIAWQTRDPDILIGPDTPHPNYNNGLLLARLDMDWWHERLDKLFSCGLNPVLDELLTPPGINPMFTLFKRLVRDAYRKDLRFRYLVGGRAGLCFWRRDIVKEHILGQRGAGPDNTPCYPNTHSFNP